METLIKLTRQFSIITYFRNYFFKIRGSELLPSIKKSYQESLSGIIVYFRTFLYCRRNSQPILIKLGSSLNNKMVQIVFLRIFMQIATKLVRIHTKKKLYLEVSQV